MLICRTFELGIELSPESGKEIDIDSAIAAKEGSNTRPKSIAAVPTEADSQDEHVPSMVVEHRVCKQKNFYTKFSVI